MQQIIKSRPGCPPGVKSLIYNKKDITQEISQPGLVAKIQQHEIVSCVTIK